MPSPEGISHLTHIFVLGIGSLAPDRREEGLIRLDRGDLRVVIENGMDDLPDGAEQVILWMVRAEYKVGCADGDRLCPWLWAVFMVVGCADGYRLCLAVLGYARL